MRLPNLVVVAVAALLLPVGGGLTTQADAVDPRGKLSVAGEPRAVWDCGISSIVIYPRR